MLCVDHASGIAGIPPGTVIQKGTQNLKTPRMYEAIVMIKNISQEEMDQFLPRRFNIDRFIGAEVEWFSDKAGTIIGTIAEGTTKMAWAYAVLRRDDNSKYRFWDLETRIESCDAARIQIVRAMEGTQKDGQACSPVVG